MASSVYMQFLGETEEEAGLTLIYAQYPEEQQMDQVRDQMTDIWGDIQDLTHAQVKSIQNDNIFILIFKGICVFKHADIDTCFFSVSEIL